LNTRDDTPTGKEQLTIEVNTQVKDIGSRRLPGNVRRSRTIQPFVFSRDIARGALYSLQALLSYALMLAVM
jgi:copper transporter 1